MRSSRGRCFGIVRVGDPVGRMCCASGTMITCNYNSRGWTTTKKGMNGGGRICGCDREGSGSFVNRL